MKRLDIVQVRLDKYLFDGRRLEKEKEKEMLDSFVNLVGRKNYL